VGGVLAALSIWSVMSWRSKNSIMGTAGNGR
jgi:hypothetical protein